MSYDEIKLDYGLAEEMAKTFSDGAEVLKDTMQEMQNIANTLEEGALLGRGGTAFVDAIRSKLCPSIAKLSEKFTQLQDDVQQAVEDMQEADQQSASQFGN
jgi:WXG100 family type VII secretion target